MRLTDQEIKDILASKGFICSNIEDYVNLDTILHLQCEHGHNIDASIRTVRNANFRCSICDGQNSISNHVAIVNVPQKQGQRVVAIDNATEKVGISVFDDGKLVYWHLYKYAGETIERLVKNRQFLEDIIIKTWEPDYIVLEDIQYQNNNILTFKILAMLLGSSTVSVAAANIKYETVLSKVWRSHFMINGKTRVQQKVQAIEKVKEMYGIDVNDDVAEAILLGKYAVDCIKKEKIKKLF